MALSILDGNQSATTLSTILTSGQHITAHTVVSLGTQAITDISGAVSGSVVSISNFPATQPVSIASVTVGNSVTIGSLPAISGTVTANGGDFASQPLGAYPSKALRIGFADDENYNAVGLASGGKPLPITLYDNEENVLGGTSNGMIPLAISGTVTVGNSVTIGSLPAISGTVTANAGGDLAGAIEIVQDINNVSHKIAVQLYDANGIAIGVSNNPLPISGTVTIGSALPTGTNRIGVVTIGAGTVTLGASTAQIGSVTASISGTVPISISSVTVGNSVTIGSLPAISGTVTANGGDFSSLNITQPISKIQVGFQNIGGDFVAVNEDGYPFPVNLFVGGLTVASENPIPISGTVTIGAVSTTVTVANHQGTTVTTSNFTSTTASTTLASANASREVLTIFNEGAGNLHICAGATCTTIAYQVRLSAGDYYEVPLNQTSLTHSAVFATAGTARVTEIS